MNMENKTEVLAVLNYHAIEAPSGKGPLGFRQRDYALSLDAFREQLDHLARDGYRSLSSREIASWFEGPRENPAPCVGLTFDDGLISHYECVLPELRVRNFKGIFFMTAALIGTQGYMNRDQLKELLKNGHEIGSHGLTHRPLTYTSATVLWRELSESKKMIEKDLGIPVDCFSVPRGYCNPRVLRTAEKASYRLVFTSFGDVNRQDGRGPRSIRRIAIKPATNVALFRSLIRGECAGLHQRETVKAFLRWIVPPGIYDLAAAVKQALSARRAS